MIRIIEGVPYSKYRARWREAGKRMLADRGVPAHTRVL